MYSAAPFHARPRPCLSASGSAYHAAARTADLRTELAGLQRADLLDIFAASCQCKAAAKDQAIVAQVEPPDLATTADVTAIAEVLKRLLDNAAKFTPAGVEIGLAVRRTPAQAPSSSPHRRCQRARQERAAQRLVQPGQHAGVPHPAARASLAV